MSINQLIQSIKLSNSMQKQIQQKIPSQKGSESKFTDLKDKKHGSTPKRKYMRKIHIQKQKKYKITKTVQEVEFKLKRGKDTPGIHIRVLNQYMGQFKHIYCKEDYFQKAQKKLKALLNEKKPLNTTSLWRIFGGQFPASDASQEIKDQFLINRMNARVLECIYQKYLLHIVFGNSKIQDKLTTLMFIQQYRTRLPNPLLCGKIECPRPMWPQKKYDNKSKSEPNLSKISS